MSRAAPLRGFGVGSGVIYQSAATGPVIRRLSPTFTIPGYTRVDSALYYKWRRYTFALNVQNIGDRRYIRPNNPRSTWSRGNSAR